MIRILHFTHIINRHDIVDSVVTRLDQSKFEVAALTGTPARRVGPYTEAEAYPIRILDLAFTRRNYPRMLQALVKEARRFRPHILHVHHYDENLVAALAQWLLLAPVPCYIIGRHYADQIYYSTSGLKQKIFLAAENFCNRTATRIFVPTMQIARLLIERQRVPEEKVAVAPFGIDFSTYHPSSPDAPARLRREWNLTGKYLVLACGRLSQEKGFEYLLQAVPAVSACNLDFRLVVVGSGPCEATLREWSHKLGVETVVQFVGWRDDALDWIAAADLVVQPSWTESFCQVLVEAYAFGKPVIMTPVGVAPEVIGKNERGRLIPPGDSAAIGSAICELMTNRELGPKLGESGRVYVHQNMGADLAARRYEQLYEAEAK